MRVLFLLSFISIATLANSQYMVTKWLNGKKAALTFNFEGNQGGVYEIGAPLLEEKKWVGTFFISTKTANWKNVLFAFKSGHEIGNHSHSNRQLNSLSIDDVNKELLTSTQLIYKYIPNYKVRSFSYPFGQGIQPGIEFDSIRTLVSKYHIGATSIGTSGGYLTVGNAIPYHAYRNRDFHKYYYQLGTMVVKSNLSLQSFNQEINKTIESGNWLSLMYYSIGTSGREHVEEGMFQSMLDSIQIREEDLWVAPFGDVVMYHQMRRNARVEYLQIEGDNWVMYLEDDLDDLVYNTPLTLQVMKPIDKTAIKITQNGNKLDIYQDWRILQFNAVPDKGPIHITYKSIKID